MWRAKGELAAIALIACNAATSAPHHEPEDAALRAADATEPDAGAMSYSTGADATASPQEAAAADDASVPMVEPLACDVDASDEAGVAYCPPPISVCADGRHLVYFDWGTCVAGYCVWPHTFMTCPIGGRCANGGCISPSITAPAAP